MTGDDVLAAERKHLLFGAECLELMKESADAIADMGVDRLASESLGKLRAARIRALASDPDVPLFFARIDRDADPLGVLHIGRRHIRDRHGDAVVIDWRVQVAEAFYQATASDRRGVTLRRRFGFDAGRLTSYEDEQLLLGDELGLDSVLVRAEIERPRRGPMRDIVATIQPDQDHLVRADLDRSLCIQGAPGTGKTAVGLHRAAYLLYTYPLRLRRAGVLVIGPNPAFLRYTAQVLPTLGEGGIAQATLSELTGRLPEAPAEPEELAVLKGDARMAEVLQRAVDAHVGEPREDVMVADAGRTYRVPRSRLRRYVDDARRSGVRWSVGRERVTRWIAEDVRKQAEATGRAPTDAAVTRLSRSIPVRAFVDEVWPLLTAERLLERLLAEADFLKICAEGMLDEDEQEQLFRLPLARSRRRDRWTAADRVLLDELAWLLETGTTYIHLIVDEAQDLSPMECRAVARRCPTGSMTVLGDLAQATTAWAPGSWQETLTHLGQPDADVMHLTAGYRVPHSVLLLANRLLPFIAEGLPPATSVRTGAGALRFAPSSDLLDVVAQTLPTEGSIGVICPDGEADEVLTRLLAARIDAAESDVEGTHRVSVLPATLAKGLEFDSVVLLDPSTIVDGAARRTDGLRRLYVSLTRAVSQLVVLYDETVGLPPELGDLPQP